MKYQRQASAAAGKKLRNKFNEDEGKDSMIVLFYLC